MKIVSWNCNGGLRKKYHALEDLNADVLVIQECEDPSQSKHKDYSDWAENYLWVGKNKNKGIGIFAKEKTKLEILDLESDSLKIFLPFVINDCFKVVAVWTQPTDSGAFRYIGQMWKYLQIHKDFIKTDIDLIIGDFNSNKIWDRKRSTANHSDVVREFSEIGILSAYHHFFNCDQGEELHPTFYMYRKIDKPYHIDYAFTSKSIINHSNIEIGSHEKWLTYSDHMPVIYTLKNDSL